MGATSSRGKRPSRLHCSMMGIRLSSMNWRAVSRERRSSSLSSESKPRKSTPLNLKAMAHTLREEDQNDSEYQGGKGRSNAEGVAIIGQLPNWAAWQSSSRRQTYNHQHGVFPDEPTPKFAKRCPMTGASA